jgi:heptosyltransferase-2
MADGPNILIIGPTWVGDMVMAQTLFIALKDLYPNSSMDVMAPAWSQGLVSRMPQIRRLIVSPFTSGDVDFTERWRLGRELRGRYDHAIVLPGSWKSALVPFFAGIARRTGYLREMRYGLLNDIVDLPAASKRKTAQNYFRLARGGEFQNPRLTVDPENQSSLVEQHALDLDKLVAFMPGAEFGASKRWPGGHYAELARKLIKAGLQVVLLGSHKDKDVTGEIAQLAPGALDLAGKTTLEDVVDIIASAKLAVTNDSGLMHVAAAVGVPTIAIYGSTSPSNTPPLTDKGQLIWLGLECSPCHQRTCPLGHNNCMKLIDADRVWGVAQGLLKGEKRK